MTFWVGVPLKSPSLCNLRENPQQLSKRRAAFRFLEKGSRGGQLSFRLTQTPVLELAGPDLDPGWFSTNGRERYLGCHMGHDWQWSELWCENVRAESIAKIKWLELQTQATCGYLNFNEFTQVHFKTQFPVTPATLQVSMARHGYHIGQNRYSAFPSSQKVLLASTARTQLLMATHILTKATGGRVSGKTDTLGSFWTIKKQKKMWAHVRILLEIPRIHCEVW